MRSVSPPSASTTRLDPRLAQAGRPRDERQVLLGVAPLERRLGLRTAVGPAIEGEQRGHRGTSGRASARAVGDRLGRSIEAAQRFECERGSAGQDIVAAVGRDEQPPVADLAAQLQRLSHRHERIAVADRDEGRSGDRAQLAGRQQRLPVDVVGDRRQEPSPRAASLDRVDGQGQLRRPGRVVAGDPLGIHQPAPDGGPRLARGRDPDHDERPQALRRSDREAERGHRPHRVADQVERASGRGRRRTPRGRRPATPPRSRPRRPSASGRGRAHRAGRAGRTRRASGSGPRTSPGRSSMRRGAGPAAARSTAPRSRSRGRWHGSSASRDATAPACPRPRPWRRARCAGTGAGSRAAASDDPPGCRAHRPAR